MLGDGARFRGEETEGSATVQESKNARGRRNVKGKASQGLGSRWAACSGVVMQCGAKRRDAEGGEEEEEEETERRGGGMERRKAG